MMRPLVIIVLALCLPLLSACDPSGQGGQGGEATGGRSQFIIVSGGQTGVYYPTAGAIANLLQKADPNLALTVQTSGGSVANARMIGAGNADFAVMQNDIAAYARDGKLMFEQPIPELLGVAALYPEHIQIIATGKSGIRSINDLRGKRVAIGAIGSGTEANALQILETYNVKESDLDRVERLKASESRDFLQDGRVDAAFFTFGVGTAAIQELALTHEIVFVPVDGEPRTRLRKQYSFYSDAVIPAGAYRQAGSGKTAVPPSDVPTVSVNATLVAGAKVPAVVVTSVLEGVFDNLDEFTRTHARLKQVNREDARGNLTLPLHPGATAFYEKR